MSKNKLFFRKKFSTTFVMLSSCGVLLADSQGDTTITGNLEIIHAGTTNTGNLEVEGTAAVAIAPTEFLTAHTTANGLGTSWYYGPFKMGDRSQTVEYTFVPVAGSNTQELYQIPLGQINAAGRVEVTVSIHNYHNIDSASWVLDGSRQSDVRCLQHSAYGSARYAEIRGDMRHGVMTLFLDIDYTSSDIGGFISKVKVTAKAETSGFNLVSLDSYTDTTKVEPISSQQYELRKGVHEHQGTVDKITGSWSGDIYRFDGEVILSEAQGDISMGVFGIAE